MLWWDRLIEDKIQTAIDEGAFDRLPGYGKKLADDLEPADDEWLGNHILHSNGVLPTWLQLRKDIHNGRQAVVHALHEYEDAHERLDLSHPGQRAILDRLEERYVAKAREINKYVDEHNVRCPSILLELPRFQEDIIRRRRQTH
ncbi:MAG TPA: DUF1992 domain-containing protein [Nitrolancea sp.]|nr:DUF1992 domain-containing protein [Nitrolancea sp.]